MFYSTNPSDWRKFAAIVDRAVEDLTDVEFDTIVVRGFSGATVGPTIAYLLGKPWALVRKKEESTHSSRTLEGDVGDTYIILDDFIDSGETVNKIVDAAYGGRCVGVYMYDSRWLSQFEEASNRVDVIGRIGGLKLLNWSD